MWVQNPLHRVSRKAHGSSVGFSVGTMLWGETSVQATSRQEDFHSVAPQRRGEQFDRPAEGTIPVARTENTAYTRLNIIFGAAAQTNCVRVLPLLTRTSPIGGGAHETAFGAMTYFPKNKPQVD